MVRSRERPRSQYPTLLVSQDSFNARHPLHFIVDRRRMLVIPVHIVCCRSGLDCQMIKLARVSQKLRPKAAMLRSKLVLLACSPTLADRGSLTMPRVFRTISRVSPLTTVYCCYEIWGRTLVLRREYVTQHLSFDSRLFDTVFPESILRVH